MNSEAQRLVQNLMAPPVGARRSYPSVTQFCAVVPKPAAPAAAVAAEAAPAAPVINLTEPLAAAVPVIDLTNHCVAALHQQSQADTEVGS